jgi:transcriptional regulator with XRE-family HTH domain
MPIIIAQTRISASTFPDIFVDDAPEFGSDRLSQDGYSLGMIEGEVFADNLRRLMDYAARRNEPELASPEALEAVSGVSRSNIYRYLSGDASPTLTKLEALARSYGLMVWQLLTPRLDPSNPPVVFVTAEEQQLYERIRAVGEQARHLEGGGIEESKRSTTGSDRGGKGEGKRGRDRPRKKPLNFP